MKIAFLTNKLTLRGSEVNLFDYADSNETILGNQSIIITRSYELAMRVSPQDVHHEAYVKFNRRFDIFYYENADDIQRIIDEQKVDVIFIEKYGRRDELLFKRCKNIIHAVFETREPHGELYTAISEALNKERGTSIPVLPNIVRVFPTNENLRSELDIPQNATVFGCYGGASQFDHEYTKKAVIDVSNNPNIYFIFMNHTPFGTPKSNIKFIPGTSNMEYKRKFINACDAMLYGRNQGETFGIACGEFSICGKPVIAPSNPTESVSHLNILKDNAITHTNYEQLVDILTNWNKHKRTVTNSGYNEYSPESVMKMFDSFLKRINV